MTKATPRPAGILIDIGGTVFRATSFDFAAGIRALNPRFESDLLLTELEGAIDVAHRTNSAEFTMAQWLAEKRDCFGMEGSVADLELVVWREAFQPTPMPGVREAFQRLDSLNLFLGCISNTVFSAQVLHRELERHGLRDSVRFLISSADFSIRKPAPEIFLAGVSGLGLNPSQTWFVGDTWTVDIEGAAAAGLFPVWLSSAEESPLSRVPHSRVASWSEVSQLATDAVR